MEYKRSAGAGVGSRPCDVVAAVVAVAPHDDAVALDVVAGTLHVHSTAVAVVAVVAPPDDSQGPTPVPTLPVGNR